MSFICMSHGFHMLVTWVPYACHMGRHKIIHYEKKHAASNGVNMDAIILIESDYKSCVYVM